MEALKSTALRSHKSEQGLETLPESPQGHAQYFVQLDGTRSEFTETCDATVRMPTDCSDFSDFH